MWGENARTKTSVHPPLVPTCTEATRKVSFHLLPPPPPPPESRLVKRLLLTESSSRAEEKNRTALGGGYSPFSFRSMHAQSSQYPFVRRVSELAHVALILNFDDAPFCRQTTVPAIPVPLASTMRGLCALSSQALGTRMDPQARSVETACRRIVAGWLPVRGRTVQACAASKRLCGRTSVRPTFGHARSDGAPGGSRRMGHKKGPILGSSTRC